MPITGQKVKFKAGLYSDYVALSSGSSDIDLSTIYFCTDTQQLFVGETEYTRKVQSGQGAPTAQSASDTPIGTLYYDSTNQVLYSNLSSSWTAVANNISISVMTGATSSQSGTSGLVPAPSSGQQDLFLKGDGSWVYPCEPIDIGGQSVDLNDLYPTDANHLRMAYFAGGRGLAENILNMPVIATGFFLTVDATRYVSNNIAAVQTLYTQDGEIFTRWINKYAHEESAIANEWTQVFPRVVYGTIYVVKNGERVVLSDLNDLTTTGIYDCGYASHYENVPDGVTGNISVEVLSASGVISQILRCIKNRVYKTFRRYNKYGSTFTAWTEDQYTDTTYSAATQGTDGLMSSTDKTKLDSITPSDLLTNSDIVVCTQAEYDAMSTRTGLLYFIKEGASS